MSTLKVNNITNLSDESLGVKAWVNFNGTGTVAINADGNVSSITDNATGKYTVNFSSSLTDGDYSATLGNARADDDTNASGMGFSKPHTRVAASLQVLTGDSATGNVDYAQVDVTVVR